MFHGLRKASINHLTVNTSVGLDYADSAFGWNVIHWGADGWPSL